MPTADASTPAPTYGTLASSSSPCTVPSSPYGPCSTGNTTSSERPVTTCRRRRAIDAEERLRAGMGDQMRLRPGSAGDRRACCDHVGGRRERRRLIGQRPASVLLDSDGDRLVAVRVEVLEHRRRRGQRHFMLARTSAVDDADAEFFHDDRTDNTRPSLDGSCPRSCCSRCRHDCKLFVPPCPSAFSFRVTHTDGRARRGVDDHRPRRGRDAGVHAGRHAGRGEGDHAPRSRGPRRRDHPRQYLSPLPAARRRAASRGSAACTGSSAGRGRS